MMQPYVPFADDVGMVLSNSTKRIEEVFRIYSQFALFSRLRLNLAKTVIIPLWDWAEIDPKSLLAASCALCREVCYSTHGTDLGIEVGPGRQAQIWSKAIDKFQARATAWKDAHQSLHYSCII